MTPTLCRDGEGFHKEISLEPKEISLELRHEREEEEFRQEKKEGLGCRVEPTVGDQDIKPGPIPDSSRN